tara:strand:+ start:446 stop:613 length:168 start_codon:yes stop_codon:yes gene_type:complete
MLFDELLRVCTEFSTEDWDLDRKDVSWVVGQLRLEIDDTGLDFEAELDDDEEDDT